MDENKTIDAQVLAEYYRSKSVQLEHDFVLYKYRSEIIIKALQDEIARLQSNDDAGNASGV